ncbi:3-hydroxyacyl-CoA dehydrogenase [Rummeliibacillus suwonensis]|uniref:3-hydroxyacyl-CoA dehydrogenase n=1 Tax=Rummeliibacillus suwonensis TaxID=1306154 RepID=UPI001AB01CC3|nr:3-hydroxyacyl-CoA dehydrogenase [Rummeliibacillus suwonensis]MBO2535283.1 3-hydroxyacyl-CoA dehydrogenase [Rummeliibacillus suwonensis]
MSFKNITVAGSGVLGSQIAFQTAFHGYNVSVYDINDAALEKAKERLTILKDTYANYFKDEEKAAAALERFTFSSSLKEAVKDADLVIEAIPELEEIKINFYKELATFAPGKTVFASNSSTMVPSQFAKYTGRPEKFLALHFANEVWKNNTAEVMGHPGTDKQYEEQVIEFAKSIGMIPLHILKEQPGYILNSLLVPFLNAGQVLLAKGVADPETIDKTWMLATGAPLGPFAILDVVGLQTAYNIVATEAKQNPAAQPIADLLKKEYIDKGKMGRATGEGFYKYPNPTFLDPDFLKA